MSLIQMSFCGGVMILAVLVLRAVSGKSLPKRTFRILWVVTLLRLLLPVSIPASFSVYSLAQQLTDAVGERVFIVRTDENGVSTAFYAGGLGLDFLPPSDSGNKETGDSLQGMSGNASVDGIADYGNDSGTGGWEHGKWNIAGRGVHAVTAIRYVGTLVCSLVFLTLYLNCLRMFRTSLPVQNGFVRLWLRKYRLRRYVAVRQSDRIATPLTYGVFHPVILLPEKLEWEETGRLEYILQHELIHIRHLDAAVKFLMTVALCLHWFNPLVWVMYAMMNRDLELACDEEVLKNCGTEARKGYALALIEMEERKGGFLPIYSSFGRNATEERIRAIMKYKKTTWAAVFASTLLVLAVVGLFATTAGMGERQAESKSTAADLDEMIPKDPPADSVGGSDENITGESETLTEGNAGEAETSTEQEAPSWLMPGMGVAAEEYSLTYTLEGMEETEPAWLVYGQGYCLLVPKEGWMMYAPDAWKAEADDRVQLWITHFTGEGQKNTEQIRGELAEQGYRNFENEDLRLYRNADGRTTVVELRKNGQDIWGIFYSYFDEAAEGWGGRLAVMAQHVGILTAEESSLTEEEEAAKKVVTAFTEAYLAGDTETMKLYLAEGVSAESEVHEMKEPVICEMKKRRNPVGDRLLFEVEIRPTEDADYLVYLSIELVSEDGGLRVAFYGLEM